MQRTAISATLSPLRLVRAHLNGTTPTIPRSSTHCIRTRTRTRTHSVPCASSSSRRDRGASLVRPAPPPLPREQQREWEELVRAAQAPLSASSSSTPSTAAPMSREEAEAEIALHPDARAPLRAEFAGDVNPRTGERGGPKREPVGRWGADPDGGGDWSFKGRVSDF